MIQVQVLLVEDNDDDAFIVGSQMRPLNQFKFTHVVTLSDACAHLLSDHQTDVVILDLTLPDSTGLDTFLLLHERFPNTPVVILSGLGDEDLATEAVGQGAQDYVPKSELNAHVLSRSLRYAIERNAHFLADRQKEYYEREMNVAREIQERLLPKIPPQYPGFEIAASCRPATICSGDFYDLVETDKDSFVAIVADVSSHGFGPALITVGARRLLRTSARQHQDLGKILSIANHGIWEDTLDHQFMTAFVARIDVPSKTFTYSAAGHICWVIDAEGKQRPLTPDGLPLGVFSDSEYTTQEAVRLGAGDLMVLATDGAFEAWGPDRNQFGKERLFDVIRAHRHRSASEIISSVVEAIEEFCRPHQPDDDITMVLVKCLTGEVQPPPSI
ncbi:MAG: SpoIIE family protein phosphatase [Planctomycetaceae bacterium]